MPLIPAANPLAYQDRSTRFGDPSFSYGAVVVHRSALIGGETLPFRWSLAHVPAHAAAPTYRRFWDDGSFLEILEIHGDQIAGNVIPHPVFISHMEQERHRKRHYMAFYKGGLVGAGFCLAGLCAAAWLFVSLSQFLAAALVAVCLPMLGVFLKEAFMHGMQVRLVTVTDPGPYIEPYREPPPQRQLPFPSDGFVDPNEAVRIMGSP